MATIADVYIIESLHPEDEGNGRFEGVFLSHLLRLHGKNPQYRYVRTRGEFETAVRKFGASNYRYLHLSAHGDKNGICTTNQDDIDHEELGELLRPHMKGRRLFISSCKVVGTSLAKEVIAPELGTSLVGPTEAINFHAAALVWATIYHLVFSEDTQVMKRSTLLDNIRKACDLFKVQFAYFAKTSKNQRGFSQNLLTSGR
ncbi:hypothetical protein [Hydrogenophaga laconesensis]|uniref:CHAT domain-containing protein n=1 Tax=Hydrogenophaga laconesensis TaxID=1805971 RepID=A0ABU1VHV7_9BURK|nr:hypothetical protein [Hydrogenophaga laconesensis]MDR7097066.1 hypothetical protein [Hydrogenophaga laconesensis]